VQSLAPAEAEGIMLVLRKDQLPSVYRVKFRGAEVLGLDIVYFDWRLAFGPQACPLDTRLSLDFLRVRGGFVSYFRLKV